MGMKIRAKAPTRIDLAGGTVDIWPLYLMLERPSTINLGINLFAEAELIESQTSVDQAGVWFRSGDQSSELGFSWEELLGSSKLETPPWLELHWKLSRHFARGREAAGKLSAQDRKSLRLELKTVAKSPAGAGLGGSSTLSVAIIGALSKWAGNLSTQHELIEIVRDTETTVIQVPAGLQDYYGAMYGELQRIDWNTGNHTRTAYSREQGQGMNDRLLLFYSGQSRNSGINNWALFKQFIDRTGPVREQFAAISSATEALHQSLVKQDWKTAGQAIAQEWSVRRGLAPGISTPEIDEAFKQAFKQGASAGKICGAGGGGCFFVYIDDPNPDLRSRVLSAVQQVPGIAALPFEWTPHGLTVT